MKYKLCSECDQPMLPKGVKKLPDMYDHVSGCPKAKSKVSPKTGKYVTNKVVK